MPNLRPTSLFLSHGGGPGFIMKGGRMKHIDSTSVAAQWYRTFTKEWPKPTAIVVVSAHFEGEGTVEVTSGEKHPLLFDYYGFPAYTYRLEYAPPGQPALAGRIIDLLRDDGFKARGNSERGYDHGVFIPLMLMYPEADIPVVQVSLLERLDPEQHLKMGTALEKVAQEQDVLIVCSGQATHNLRRMDMSQPPGEGSPEEVAFVDWLKDTATSPALSPGERRRRLKEWEVEAPHGREAHPREEHLLPMHVAQGCVGFRPGKLLFEDWQMGGMSLACFGFWAGASGGGGDRVGDRDYSWDGDTVESNIV